MCCVCWLCSEASSFFFAHGTANPSMSPQVCVQICSNWGFDYPGPGISVGDRPGRMAKCMWGASSFNSRPGWSGLCFSSALGCLGGASRDQRGLKGLQSRGTDRQLEGAPRCDYGTGTPSTNGQARRTDGWSSSRISQHKTRKPTSHHRLPHRSRSRWLMLTLR